MRNTQRDHGLRKLHESHAPELHRFAIRLTRDRHAAEDIVQEALLRAWRDPRLTNRSDAAARAWLYTVVRNLVIDRWRSAASRYETVTESMDDVVVGDRSAEVLDRLVIADALAALSPEHRQVIAAGFYEGQTVPAISASLGIPEGTVKSRMHYGLRSLRLALNERGVTHR